MNIQQEDKDFIFLATRYVLRNFYNDSEDYRSHLYVSSFTELADGTKVILGLKHDPHMQYILERDAGMCRTSLSVVCTVQQREISDEELNTGK